MNEQPPSDAVASGEALGALTQDARGAPSPDVHTALSIARQYIKDFSFENPNAPAIYSAFRDEGPELKISVDIAASPLEENSHEVVVSLNVRANHQDTTAFIIELEYGAQAVIEESVSEEKLERALMIEVPRLVFPFLRNIVANATRDGGFPPLLLTPINFRKIHDSHRRKSASASPKHE